MALEIYYILIFLISKKINYLIIVRIIKYFLLYLVYMFTAHMFFSKVKNKFLPWRRMACSYAKAWANSIVRKNFNFLEKKKKTIISKKGSCLRKGQHSIFVIIYLLLHIKNIFFDSVSKILFNFFMYKNRRWNIFWLI